ncbi:hypothetical protein ACFFK0_07925 [Paenibacillus chartarius]|uniref:Uncharacterized protein n=1 Tax=Paenibacillus chartarius TaxID=747481 RepID=A0ABV6DID4_9BACL
MSAIRRCPSPFGCRPSDVKTGSVNRLNPLCSYRFSTGSAYRRPISTMAAT